MKLKDVKAQQPGMAKDWHGEAWQISSCTVKQPQHGAYGLVWATGGLARGSARNSRRALVRLVGCFSQKD